MRRLVETVATMVAAAGGFALAAHMVGLAKLLLWTLAGVALAIAWSLGRWLTDDP